MSKWDIMEGLKAELLEYAKIDIKESNGEVDVNMITDRMVDALHDEVDILASRSYQDALDILKSFTPYLSGWKDLGRVYDSIDGISDIAFIAVYETFIEEEMPSLEEEVIKMVGDHNSKVGGRADNRRVSSEKIRNRIKSQSRLNRR